VLDEVDAGALRARVPAGAAGDAHDAVRAAVRERRPDLAVRGVLVQRHLSGVELLAGAYRDPQFGPMVTVGLGGIPAEALADVAVRVAPVGVADALAMLRELRGAAVLTGARIAPRVVEAEVNPLVATAAGAVAVDALVVPGAGP
jgi:acetate---CoA ligase (ADP-forming)